MAGGKNLGSLVTALEPLLTSEDAKAVHNILADHARVAAEAVDAVWQRKLGLVATYGASERELLEVRVRMGMG